MNLEFLQIVIICQIINMHTHNEKTTILLLCLWYIPPHKFPFFLSLGKVTGVFCHGVILMWADLIWSRWKFPVPLRSIKEYKRRLRSTAQSPQALWLHLSLKTDETTAQLRVRLLPTQRKTWCQSKLQWWWSRSSLFVCWPQTHLQVCHPCFSFLLLLIWFLYLAVRDRYISLYFSFLGI